MMDKFPYKTENALLQKAMDKIKKDRKILHTILFFFPYEQAIILEYGKLVLKHKRLS